MEPAAFSFHNYFGHLAQSDSSTWIAAAATIANSSAPQHGQESPVHPQFEEGARLIERPEKISSIQETLR